MKKTSTWFAAIIIAAGMGGTLLGATLLEPGGAAGQDSKAIKANPIFQQRDVEGTRDIHININGGRTRTQYFNSSSEINVYTLTLSNGRSPSQTDAGQLVFHLGGGGRFTYCMEGFRSQTINFNPPLKIRSGDRIAYYSEDAGSYLAGDVMINLHGTPPSSNKLVIK